MAKNDLITTIDQATVALQEARLALVAGAKQSKASAQAKTPSPKSSAKPAVAKRVRSEEARQRMAEAQRKRWADKKKAAKKAARLAKQS
jgi:hypothetical protein